MPDDTQVVLVTGGTRGIGLAAALAFARRGARVAVSYAGDDVAAARAVAALEATGARALAHRADVADEAAVRTMVERVAETFGGLDVLVNNAGWTRRVRPHRELDRLEDAIWDRVWAVNVKGAFYCVRAAVPHFERRGQGSVVNVTSVAALNGTGSSMAYAASKAALGTLTLSLARALAPRVRVNAVAPGLVATGFGDFLPGEVTATAAASPEGRLATVEEVALAIVHAATTPGLTGQTFVVDGGLHTLGPRA